MADHAAQDLKGRLKKAAGDVTGDQGLRREGSVDQASAAAKKKVDRAANKVKAVVNPQRHQSR